MKLPLLVVAICLSTVKSQELIALTSDGEASVSDGDNSAGAVSTSEVFVPTDSWQEIKPGQAIPRGLHVRINMETGKKEAKWLQEEAESVDQEQAESPFDPQEIKEALKNIKNDGGVDVEATKQKFRSMDQIKEEFGDMNIKVESENEIMAKLMSEFESATEDEARAEVIETLEYYVHKYDNAVDFLAMRGVERVLIPALNSTVDDLKVMAGFLIGSAAQSNPKVQVYFLEAGLPNILLRSLSSPSSPAVLGKTLYGLSAVLRNFPEAQNYFLRNGGLDVFKSLFKHEGKLYEKLKIKMITLVQDLVEERQLIESASESGRIKAEQYSRTNLPEMLAGAGWCETFDNILILPRDDRRSKRDDIVSTILEEYPVRIEHDSIEKIVKAMSTLVEYCQPAFQTNQSLNAKLGELSAVYDELRQREELQQDTDLFFTNIYQAIQDIRTTFVSSKTEL